MLGADKVCREICCIFTLPDEYGLSEMNVPHLSIAKYVTLLKYCINN